MHNSNSLVIDRLETWVSVIDDKVLLDSHDEHSLTFHEEHFSLRRIGSVSLTVHSNSCWLTIVFAGKDEDSGYMLSLWILKSEFECYS